MTYQQALAHKQSISEFPFRQDFETVVLIAPCSDRAFNAYVRQVDLDSEDEDALTFASGNNFCVYAFHFNPEVVSPSFEAL